MSCTCPTIARGRSYFHDFCETVIDRWQLRDQVQAAQVVKFSPLRPTRFRLQLDDGQHLEARRVVLATGGGSAQVPHWVGEVNAYPSDRLCHAQEIALPQLPDLMGETVLIVGSGQSALIWHWEPLNVGPGC